MSSRAVFVSPHLDDAALSCGGAIARLVRAGTQVEVVTVFTADQPLGQPLSPLARRMHASWAAGDQPFAVRRAEDECALNLLGATGQHLGLLDAMYRRSPLGTPLYADPLSPVVNGDVAGLRPQLMTALLQALAVTGSPDTLVFCPEGTGGHVDHVLVRQAIEQVVPAEQIVYFDEYPYSARVGAAATGGPSASDSPAAASDSPAAWTAHALPLTAEELDARIAAIACYRSQLRGLFPTREEIWREIVSARIPLLGHWLLGTPDVEASTARMAEQVSRDVTAAGGERYRWSPRRESPFAPARALG